MKKIGELKGKPIVECNPNEIKNNQIHAKTEGGGITLSERKNGSLEIISGGNSGNTSGSSSKYVPRYFSIDFNIADEGWKSLLSIRNVNNIINDDNITTSIGSIYKLILVEDNMVSITTYPFTSLNGNKKFYFSYIPLYIDERLSGSLNINKYGFLEFEDIIEIMPILLETLYEKNITLSMNGITEITEEEFYKID